MKIVLAGSTGLIGGLVAQRLDPQQLFTVGRRANPAIDLRVTQHVSERSGWSDVIAAASADVAICALGTTIRAAGSQDAFAAIDRDTVLAFAKAAKAGGARQFMMVSSTGANANASNFYLRIKGESEAGVSAMGFERVDIFRPGLLRGTRGGEARLGERIGIAISPITDFLTPAVLDQYRSIAAEAVAVAIIALTGNAGSGVHIHHNREMKALVR